MAHPHVRIAPPMLPRNDEDFAAVCIAVDLAALEANRAHRIEMAEAELGIAGLSDESQTWRVSRATDLRNAALRGMPKEQKGETILAPNGVEQDREELERARRLYDQIDPTRGGRSRH
jgi:DNA primase